MLFSRYRRQIINTFYYILAIIYGILASNFAYLKASLFEKNWLKAMLTGNLLFGGFFIISFIIYRFISKSDFWEKGYRKTAFLGVLTFIIAAFVRIYLDGGKILENLIYWLDFCVIAVAPATIIFSVILGINSLTKKSNR